MTSLDNPGAQRLTPAELQTADFRRAPLGRRGYDEDQVRAFLHGVEQELVRVLNEKAALQNEVGRLRDRISGSPQGISPAQAEDAHMQAVRILSTAQETADHYVADAQRYSQELAEEARRNRDEILAEAKARAVMVLEEAHRQASTAAEQVRPSSSAPLSDDERRNLESEITYLRTFSDVYRTHLRSYLEALLKNLEEWGNSEHETMPPTRLPPPRSR
ncbi:DivIVA domain-containing protein [Actinoallomurus sp. NBC_01490]|uniref:DivIVA domain-containing protein n=1 Tax=Actinoallomurus sp. NBC_01490 TaxID=2903557 RepID=UPI002E35C5DC|nr:DivIVA domain-containing protein [Actinoallomurus sp. NBC_01490]